MNLELLHKKILEHCRNAGYSQKALANELSLHTSTLSRKFNPEATTNQLTHNEVKQIIQILVQWQAIFTREQAEELLSLAELGLNSLNWEAVPFNRLEAHLAATKIAKVSAEPKARAANSLPERESLVAPIWTESSSSSAVVRPFHNLPAFATPLVGRQEELNQLKNLVLHNNTRLLTMTGPGGIGKTRLASQLGYRLLEHFEQGVCFVELASLSDPKQLAGVIAHACGLSEIGGKAKKDTDAVQQLKNYLATRRQLLILDNFEQLTTTPEAALLLSQLVAAAPGVKFIVTSRNLLKIYGEYEFRVAALTLPVEQGNKPIELEELLRQDAINLFLQRAQAANSRFNLTEENSPYILQICRRLEGIPLALELAAARLRLFSPKLLLERLNQSFALLSGGAQDMPGRHQAVRTTIEWSYRLLTEAEKIFFRRLAIFENGATLEAISSVLDFSLAEAKLLDNAELDVFEAVGSLVEKSILQQIETFTGQDVAQPTEAGEGEHAEAEMRFVLLEMVREFAQEELQKAPAAEVVLLKQRHAAYFTQMAETAEPELRKANQDFWLARLYHDYPNLQAVLQWSTAAAETDPPIALRLTAALINFWQIRGRFSEGLQWVETTLGCAEHPDSPELAKLLASAARLYITRCVFDVAEAYLQRALDLAQAYNDQALLGRIYLLQAVRLTYYQQDFATSRELIQRGLELSRRAKNDTQVEVGLNQLCQIETKCSNYTIAAELAEQLHQLSRKTGDKFALFDALYMKSEVAYYLGDYPAVYRLGKESLALLRHTPDRLKQLKSQVMLGLACEEQGKYAEARQYFETARDVYEELGSLRNYIGMQHNLAHLESLAGNFEEAVEKFKLLVAQWERVTDKLGIAETLQRLAECMFYQGDFETARQYCEQSIAIYRQTDTKKGVADILCQLAKIEKAGGNYEAAAQLLHEGMEISQALKLQTNIAQILSEFGRIFRVKGEYAQADESLRQALVIFRQIANPRGEIDCLTGLAELEITQGNFETAANYLQTGLPLATSLNSKLLVAPLLQQLGHLKLKQAGAVGQKNPTQAQSFYSQTKSYLQENLAICVSLNLQTRLPETLTMLSQLFTRLGQTEPALEVAGYCQALLEKQQARLELYPYRTAYETNLQELENLAASSATVEQALARGRRLGLPDIERLLH